MLDRLFSRIVYLLNHTLFKHYTYTIRFGFMKGLKREGGFGFVSQLLPMTVEERFLNGLDLAGKTVYDVGGFVGILTLFFAKSVGNGRVVTFEPNPENYERICEHVRMNHSTNVEVIKVGIGRERTVGVLWFNPAYPAQGSFRQSIQKRIMRDRTSKSIETVVDSIDNQIALNSLPKPDFVKIDVEGLEFDVLLGMAETIKQYGPSIYVELHSAGGIEKAENAYEVVRLLEGYRYSLYHVESGKAISLANMQVASEGHLYAWR